MIIINPQSHGIWVGVRCVMWTGSVFSEASEGNILGFAIAGLLDSLDLVRKILLSGNYIERFCPHKSICYDQFM